MRKSLIYDWWLSGESIDADYQAVLDFAAANAITAPSDFENIYFSNLIKQLKSVGFWTRCKTANIYGYGSTAFGTINLKNPNTYRHVETGTVTYAQRRGIKSASSANRINSGFKTNEYAGIENDLTTFCYISENGTLTLNQVIFGSYTTLGAATNRYTMQLGSRFQYEATADTYRQGPANGTRIMTVDATNTLSVFSRDGLAGTTAATIVAPTLNNDMLILSNNTATTQGAVTAGGNSCAKYFQAILRFDKMTLGEIETLESIWENFITGIKSTTSEWYVRPAGTTYGTGDGTSYANAFSGFTNINWNDIQEYDTLYVCGTHFETLTTNANRIIISGGYEPDPGIIDGQNTRNECITVQNSSKVTIEDLELIDALVTCLDIRLNCVDIVVNRVIADGSGNQGFQNETTVYVTYNDCIGRNCGDDGMSLHAGAVVTANNCTFNNNAQGVNAILDAVYISNNCIYSDNTTENIRPQADSDFTINGGSSINGNIVGDSSVALKLNGVTIVNSPISGNVIVS